MIISNNKLKRIRIFTLIAVLIMIASISAVTSAFTNGYEMSLMKKPELSEIKSYRVSKEDAADKASFTSENPVADGYSKVAENKTLILYLKDDNTGIKLFNKTTGYIWESRVADNYLEKEASESFKNAMTSLLTFSYIELTGDAANITVKQAYSCNEPSEITREKITGGIRLKYNFTKLNIKLALDLTLDDNALVSTILNENIYENEEGVDRMTEVKAELEKEIEEIRTVCESIKSAVQKNSAYSDSKKKAVELKINAVLNILITLKNQAGTGELKVDLINNLYTYVKDTANLTSDMKSLEEKLKKIKENSAQISEKAGILSKGKSTGIVSLSALPYFGYQTSDINGYAFYPDGSGAISYFNKDHPTMSGGFAKDVYNKHGDLVAMAVEDENSYNDYAAFPVYGVKTEKDAFTAIITEGDSDCQILFNPTQPDKAVSNVCSSYYFRKSTTMVNSTGGHTYVYDTQRIKNNWETRYVFLTGADANYSGMARAYRYYLEKTGRLNRSPLMDKKQMPIGFEFYMGRYSKKQSILNTYYQLTKFSDVKAFLERFSGKGIDNCLITMTNWSKDAGLNEPAAIEPASGIGGETGLKELSKYAKEKGILLSVDNSVVWVDSTKISFAKTNIATVKAKSQMTRNYFEFRALNPVYIYNLMVNHNLDKYKELGVNALYLYGINGIYYDYNKNAPVERKETASLFSMMEKTIREKLGYIVLDDYPSQYLLSAIDWAPYLWDTNTEYLFTDEDVPFYQIVIHGSIVYNAGSFNYFYDKDKQVLKQIEYGNIPQYFLTQEETFELRNAGIKGLYSTVLSDWEDRIVEDYHLFSDAFQDTWNIKMQSHEKMNEDIVKVSYENNIKIYLNYSDSEVILDGVTVPAVGYKIVR